MPRGRGSLELLESEREMCNLLSKYSPGYVRSRVLKTPGDATMVLVRSATALSSMKQQHVTMYP